MEIFNEKKLLLQIYICQRSDKAVLSLVVLYHLAINQIYVVIILHQALMEQAKAQVRLFKKHNLSHDVGGRWTVYCVKLRGLIANGSLGFIVNLA